MGNESLTPAALRMYEKYGLIGDYVCFSNNIILSIQFYRVSIPEDQYRLVFAWSSSLIGSTAGKDVKGVSVFWPLNETLNLSS